MLNSFQHCADTRFRIFSDESGDAAHTFRYSISLMTYNSARLGQVEAANGIFRISP
jgi:hypothetical protein